MSDYTYVIPDLHGRMDLLAAALKKAGENKIVFLGDYIDRGPQSAQVVDTIRNGIDSGKPWVALKGNHEDMMVAALVDGPEGANGDWLMNGGSQTIRSYGGNGMAMEDDAEWMQRLPLWHEDELRVYVHASARENFHPKDTPESTLLWARYRKGLDIGCMGKHVVHGHTPYNEPETLTNRTNLDCGAVFTGILAMGFFDNKTPGPLSIIYVKPE